METALTAAQIGVWQWIADTDTLTTGSAFHTLFNVAPGHAVDSLEALLALIHADERAAVTSTLHRMLESDTPLHVAFRPLTSPSGARLALHGGAVMNAQGERIGVSGVVKVASEIASHRTDAALHSSNLRLEQRVIERTAALAASEQRLQAANDLLIGIANATPDLVAALDLNLCYIAANETYRQNFREIFGTEAAIGVNLADALAHLPTDQAMAVDLWTRALQGEIVSETAEFGDPNLDRRVYDLRFGPLRDRAGNIVGAAEIASDVTERQRLYERVDAARREAEEANATKLRFLGMVSHELRTPLTSIKGFLTTLLADDVVWPAEQQREFLQIADEEADKLTALVEQLLDLSRLQAGHLEIQPLPVRIAHIVDIAAAQLAVLASRHQLRIQLNDGLPTVLADSERIAQVLANLVANAVKFSPPGSPITLTARQVDGDVLMSVSDEGRGIVPENRDIVFEAFRQIERDSGGRTMGGAGLGLAICKGLVEAHGGRIWIEDTPPPGTTVSFTLPPA